MSDYKIPDRQNAFNAFARAFLMPDFAEPNGHARAKKGQDLGPSSASRHIPSDEDVLEAARKARNAAKFASLYDGGDISAYDHDDSRADEALVGMLAFYTQDADQLERLFEASALMRPKWSRRDYRERTIRFALDNVRETYDWSRAPRNSVTNSIRVSDAVSLKRLKDVEQPGPMRYVVDDLVPEAFPTIIYGDGGVAKSMLAMSVATAIASSKVKTWMKRKVQTARVAYADFELDEGEQRRRASRVARGALIKEIPDDLYYVCAVGQAPEKFLRDLHAACVTANIKVVILDSLGMALAGDPQSPTDVIGFNKRSIDPFRASGITVVIVDHQSKTVAGERYQDKRAFGSVYKENCARSVVQIQPQQRGKGMLRVKVRHTKTNFGSELAPFGIEFKFSEEQVRVKRFSLEAGELAEERTMNLRDKVLLYLKDGPAFPKEIAENTKSDYQSVKNEITRMRRQELVENTGEEQGQSRQVRLTDSGKAAASVIASQTYIGGNYAVTPEDDGGGAAAGDASEGSEGTAEAF